MTPTERLQNAIDVIREYIREDSEDYGCAYIAQLALRDILIEMKENENRPDRD